MVLHCNVSNNDSDNGEHIKYLNKDTINTETSSKKLFA